MNTTENKFAFTDANMALAQQEMQKYPIGRQNSAILAILEIAQQQNGGWLSNGCIEYVSELLQVPHITVYEIASFYSMFNLTPVGKYHIQVCCTTPCWLRGANKILSLYQKLLQVNLKQVSQDQLFSISEVECLGACRNAPVVQINYDYYENLNETKIVEIIHRLKQEQNKNK